MMGNELEKLVYDKFLLRFELSDEDKRTTLKSIVVKKFKKDEIIYPKDNCHGYAIVLEGEMRGYISTQNFKEITVFNLKTGDSCVLCAFCSFKSTNLEINLQIIKDTNILLIPKEQYKKLRETYPQVANHTLELIANRFASAISVMEQALFVPLADRIKNFLSENGAKNGLKITHEQIAGHLGSAREAVSRVLKEMEKLGVIRQKRGFITLM